MVVAQVVNLRLSPPPLSLSEKAFLYARLWSSVLAGVRTASGSDRIKTRLSRTTNVLKCIHDPVATARGSDTIAGMDSTLPHLKDSGERLLNL